MKHNQKKKKHRNNQWNRKVNNIGKPLVNQTKQGGKKAKLIKLETERGISQESSWNTGNH
jgi:hypothetical protein